MEGKNLKKWNIIIMLLSAIIIVVCGLSCFQNIKASLRKQEISSLRDVANQNAIVIEKALEARLDFLESIATMMRTENMVNDEQILKVLKDVPKVYGLKRIGFVRPDGTAFTTDGYEQNLSFREFFAHSMNGNRYIANRLLDRMGKSGYINVFSVPVFSKKDSRVVGVLFSTYDTAKFGKTIDVPSFDNNGYCIITDDNGYVIADSEKSPMAGTINLIEAWSRKSPEASNFVKNLANKAHKHEETYGSVISEGKEKLIYFVPLKSKAHENSLYLLTIVPANTLINRLLPVANTLQTMLIATSLIIMLSLGYIFFNMHRRDKELYEIAYVDALTGGDNYASFKQKWKHMEHINGFIVAFDIDRFGNVSQLVGTEKSSELLKEVCDLLKRQLTSEEMLAHVEQDEFILLLCAKNPMELQKRIDLLGKHILSMSMELGMPALHAVFGVYAAQEVINVDAAYSCAIQAKNTIKGNYNKYCGFYNDASVVQAKECQELADNFTSAIEHKAFEVWYQPKINTQTEQIVGAEALVRWRQLDGSMISPGKFIPVFEGNGMIAVLDEYVFSMVCSQQKKWREAGINIVPVSINVSRASLRIENIAQRYSKIAAEYGIDTSCVQLEITESATVSDENLEECLKEFHDAGFKLLLDDFGSGYSSLVDLYHMPFDVIKLDKSLIDYIEENQGGQLVRQMIAYAKSMGRSTTAEGVESKSQLELLRSMECDDIQGFYYDKPMVKEKFASKYLKA